MLVTIFLDKEYDLTAHSDEGLRIDGLVRLPELDVIDNDTLVDAIEMQINDLGLVLGQVELSSSIVRWAVTLTDDERYQVIGDL